MQRRAKPRPPIDGVHFHPTLSGVTSPPPRANRTVGVCGASLAVCTTRDECAAAVEAPLLLACGGQDSVALFSPNIDEFERAGKKGDGGLTAPRGLAMLPTRGVALVSSGYSSSSRM